MSTTHHIEHPALELEPGSAGHVHQLGIISVPPEYGHSYVRCVTCSFSKHLPEHDSATCKICLPRAPVAAPPRSVLDELDAALTSISHGVAPSEAIMKAFSIINEARAVAAPVNDGGRSQCASCKHRFCKECNEIDECCKCDTAIPPRTVAERLAQHAHIDIVEGVLGGVNPLVSRRRISVHHILGYLYNGESVSSIAENYELEPEAIKDAIAFAQDVYGDAVDSALRYAYSDPSAAARKAVEDLKSET